MRVLPFLCALTANLCAQAPMDPFGEALIAPVAKEINQHEGTWRAEIKGGFLLKSFHQGFFLISQIDPAQNLITSTAVGIYQVDDQGIMKEKVRVALEPWKDLTGRAFSSPVGRDGESIYSQRGFDGHKQVWVKQTSNGGTLQQVADFTSILTDMDGMWWHGGAETRTVKFYDRGRGACVRFDMKTKAILNQHLFIYSFDNRILKEQVLFTTPGWRKYQGTLFTMKTAWTGPGNLECTHTNGRIESFQRFGVKPKVGRFTGEMKR